MPNILKRLSIASAAALVGSTFGLATAAHAATVVTCGQVVTTSVTVGNNIGPCLGDGLVVQGNGIIINLGGHTITGAAFDPASAIDQAGINLDGVSGVTVENGTVRGFFVGVLVKGGTGNTVTHMTADHNIGLGKTLYNDGIVLDGATHNRVTSNTVTGNGPDAGIAMKRSADYNSVDHNTVTDNNVVTQGQGPGGSDVNYDEGIQNDSKSSYNVASANVVLRNGFDGISLGGTGPTSHDKATNNTIRDNGHMGINAGGNGNFVSYNVIEHNGGGGIVTCGQTTGLCGPDFTTIEHNRVTANNGFGIGTVFNGSQDAPGADPPGSPFLLYAAPRSNLVQYNVVRNNTGDGIYIQCDTLYDVDGNGTCLTSTPAHMGMRILRNVALNNGGAGAGVTAWDLHDENPNCDHDIWSHNIARTANPPCTLAK